MNIRHRIKKFKQRKRILRKIRDQLPKYHPESGQRLEWRIVLGYRHDIKYDTKAGKIASSIFVPKPLISQEPMVAMCDRHVYRYNWTKKQIERVDGAYWR